MLKKKIAIFLNCLEPIFFSRMNQLSCYVLVDKESPLYSLAQKNLPASQVIPFSFSKKTKKHSISLLKTLAEPDLVLQLKKNKITHFVVPHRLSKTLVLWSRKHKLKLIGIDLKQQRLENKLYFDNLLKKNGLSSPRTLSLADLSGKSRPKTWVAQTEESFGFFGTRFFSSFSKWRKFFKQQKSGTKMLVREYLSGPSLGVSIFLDKQGNYFYSALRRQCFSYDQGFPKSFLGLQWLPKSFLSPQINHGIDKILLKLKKVLVNEGFYGLANFDFLIHKGKPLILECNPRLSSATPQIFSVPTLTNCPDPWRFYLNIFFGLREEKIKATNLPPSKFAGAILDIDVKQEIKIKKVLAPGVYVWQKNKLVWFSDSFADYHRNPQALFLFHEFIGQEQLQANETLCTIFSQQPLFRGNLGSLNTRGLKIYQFLFKEFFGKKYV